MKTPLRTSFQALALAALVSVSTNCASPKFERDWKNAVAARSAAGGKGDAIVGPWQGTWLSHANAHTGDLRCLAEPKAGTAPGQPGDYTFRYHATWGKLFQGGFAADFPAVKEGRSYRVKGTKSLGLFGGFEHDGTISGDAFTAKYSSEQGDHGVFNMKRP